MNQWLWLIPGSPLIGALLIAVFGGFFRPGVSSRIAALAAFISAMTVLGLWIDGGAHRTFQQTLYTWMAVGDWQPTISFTIDRLSLVMVSVASGVGFLIHLFSVRFMAGDYGERRYFFYLNAFIVGMLSFVMADNLIQLYFGWELMGLCSYALVAHWYRKQHNAFCGRKAFVVTRIGDTALALAIFLIFVQFGALSFGPLFDKVALSGAADTTLLTWITALILIAGMAKSAQFPLQVWLPDAMTGPSTVSALIHAATMVTAGVYIIARLHPLFNVTPDVRWLVALVGAVTLVYAASAGLAQRDIKRVLAFSTVSQIGYMFLALGIGAYGLAIFHLLVHACFKALLFMSSGVVIRVYKGDHDIRNMGGLARQQPWLHWCFFAGIITLAAVPLITASFYSKDDIIAAAWTAPQGILLWGLALLGAVLTGTYSFRLYLMVFAGRPRGETIDYRMPVAMKLPLAILAVLSIVIGFIQMPQGWPGPHWLLPWLEPLLGQVPEPDLTTAYWLQLVGAIASVLGIALAYPVVRRERQGGGLSNNQFLLNSWHMDSLYDFIIVRPYYALAAVCRIAVERFLLNGGVVGSVVGVLRTGHRLLSLSQNGQLSRYAGIMILGAALVLGYHLWLG